MSWRETITSEFTPEQASVTRLTVVSDPDELLLEQGVLAELRSVGFELVPFDDPVAFRFLYERRFRQYWDRGETTNLVVVLRTPQASVDSLPFDLLQEARRAKRVLHFGISRVFPELVPSVVRQLDPRWFDTLWSALRATPQGQLNDSQTREFILRAVFDVVPEHIKTPPQLLRLLLMRHYAGVIYPPNLDAFLIERMLRSEGWAGWPLGIIIPQRKAFFTFLQERWPQFLNRTRTRGDVPDTAASPGGDYGLEVPGPLDLPFGHDDVRGYIDRLFTEGLLQRVPASPDLSREGWWSVGVEQDSPESALARFMRLGKLVDEELPSADVPADGWLAYAPRFAEWLASRWEVHADLNADARGRAEKLHDSVEDRFYGWLAKHYASLPSLPYLPSPRMVHHVALWARHSLGRGSKLALVVVDGLAWDQWVLLRRQLGYRSSLQHDQEESAVFAWLPTLTSISRQSIFAGQPPMYFESSIGHLRKEPEHWNTLWAERGMLGPAVGFISQGKRSWADFMGAVTAEAEHPHRKVLGIVVYKIDKTLHDLEFDHGSAGMHAMVKHWGEQGELANMFDLLLEQGFEIVLTSDHGNIEAHGIGKPNVGQAAESRGQRVHVFADDHLRRDLRAKVPDSRLWPGPGLPDSIKALFPPGRAGFVKKGPSILAHGGPSLEEVIVPLVRIRRRR